VPEPLLTILKFLLLALLYLFFLRVLRAVWAEVGSPKRSNADGGGVAPAAAKQPGGGGARSSAASRATPKALKVLEPADQKGQSFALMDEMTVGRAAGCQVRVDDGYASQLHARLYRQDGQLFVEDLGSTNGTYVNRKGAGGKEKVSGPLVLRTGDRLSVGRTVLEVTK
jgi:pSer/pThr/pTyr-binding forkhead associated (FHA) protein